MTHKVGKVEMCRPLGPINKRQRTDKRCMVRWLRDSRKTHTKHTKSPYGCDCEIMWYEMNQFYSEQTCRLLGEDFTQPTYGSKWWWWYDTHIYADTYIYGETPPPAVICQRHFSNIYTLSIFCLLASNVAYMTDVLFGFWNFNVPKRVLKKVFAFCIKRVSCVDCFEYHIVFCVQLGFFID